MKSEKLFRIIPEGIQPEITETDDITLYDICLRNEKIEFTEDGKPGEYTLVAIPFKGRYFFFIARGSVYNIVRNRQYPRYLAAFERLKKEGISDETIC